MPDGRPSLIWLEENLMGEFVDMEGPFEKTCTNKELYEFGIVHSGQFEKSANSER